MTVIDFINDYEKISKDNKHATYFHARTMFEFAEDYHQAKLKLLGIADVIVPFYCGEQKEGRQICDSQCMGCDVLERNGK